MHKKKCSYCKKRFVCAFMIKVIELTTFFDHNHREPHECGYTTDKISNIENIFASECYYYEYNKSSE